MHQSPGWPPRCRWWPERAGRSNPGNTIHCSMVSDAVISIAIAFRGWEYGRDNARHDTLVIAKEEDA